MRPLGVWFLLGLVRRGHLQRVELHPHSDLHGLRRRHVCHEPVLVLAHVRAENCGDGQRHRRGLGQPGRRRSPGLHRLVPVQTVSGLGPQPKRILEALHVCARHHAPGLRRRDQGQMPGHAYAAEALGRRRREEELVAVRLRRGPFRLPGANRDDAVLCLLWHRAHHECPARHALPGVFPDGERGRGASGFILRHDEPLRAVPRRRRERLPLREVQPPRPSLCPVLVPLLGGLLPLCLRVRRQQEAVARGLVCARPLLGLRADG
mmetsp:Transcript_44921/g.143071  ORF Transcript_44921/g.143071 Transcript_44921/m.143071 type:complete len:264 (+) Transcript_44921:622-1413(+)